MWAPLSVRARAAPALTPRATPSLQRRVAKRPRVWAPSVYPEAPARGRLSVPVRGRQPNACTWNNNANTACTECDAGSTTPWSSCTTRKRVRRLRRAAPGLASIAWPDSTRPRRPRRPCINCAVGKVTVTAKMTVCSECVAGMYSAEGTCIDCVAGQYQAANAQTSCINCVVGKLQGPQK